MWNYTRTRTAVCVLAGCMSLTVLPAASAQTRPLYGDAADSYREAGR